MDACLFLGIVLTVFGLYVLIKLHFPHKWESAEGTIEKTSEGTYPTYCVKTDSGEAGWTPYYKKHDEGLEDGKRIKVLYYRRRTGELVVVPQDAKSDTLITKKHGIVSLCLGAANLTWYFIWLFT